MLEYLPDYAGTAVGRLLQQYRKPRFEALATELGTLAQEIEDGLWALGDQSDVWLAEGVWLDRLGSIVGELRGALTDEPYRAFVFARIRANQSRGGLEDVYAVLAAWDETLAPTLSESLVLAMVLDFNRVLTDDQVERWRKLLRSTRAGGVCLMWLYQLHADASSCFFATGTSPEASTTQGLGDSEDPSVGGYAGGAVRC